MSERDEEFRQFVAERSAGLLRLAYLLCGEHAGAEDLVQIALIRTCVRWPRIHSDRTAYVRRVLVTVAIDEGRRAFRRREQMVDELPERPSAPGPFDDIVDRDRLRMALLALPPRQRAALVLRHWLDLDAATTAGLLGCTPETVRSQSQRGLTKLREVYGIAVAVEGERDA